MAAVIWLATQLRTLVRLSDKMHHSDSHLKCTQDGFLFFVLEFLSQLIKILSIYSSQYRLYKSRKHVNHLYSHVNARY